MNQVKIDHLIREGENKYIDFKRLLDLSNASGKSEFIKDISSLANSARTSGYLIIGVEDNKDIVGCGYHEEEQLQQIAHRYIEPPVELTVFACNKNDKDIYIFEVKPTTKPHKISRDFDRLERGSVYIRHGTVTFKATADEIINLSRSKMSLSYIMESLFNFSKRVESGEINFDDKIELALKTAQTAIVSTQAYLRDGGYYAETREFSKESELADLWHQASRPMRIVDPELAEICHLKGGYWSNVDSWENTADTDISLKKVEVLIAKLLKSQ